MIGLVRVLAFLLRISRSLQLSRLRVGLALGASVVGGAANAALLAVINRSLHLYGIEASYASLGWIFMALCVVLPASLYMSQLLLVQLMARAMLDLREELTRRILATPLRRLERTGAHRLLATLTQDVAMISQALSDLPLMAMHTAFIVSCMVYLGILSWQVLLLVLVFMALGIVSYRIPTRRAFRHFERLREEGDHLYERFEGITDGAKELKLHRRRRQDFLSLMFDVTGEALRHHTVRGNAIYFAAASWGHALFFVVTGLLIFVVPRFQPTSAETLTGYALTLLYMRGPLTILLTRLPGLSQAIVATRKVDELGLSLANEPAEAEAEEEPEPGWRRLELRQAELAYEVDAEDRFVLGPIDLAFEPGELVFLVGGNGSGKTTLAKILAGLYDLDGGALLLDGVEINDRNRDRYRQLFSVVFSDFFLFEALLGLGDSELDSKAREYLSRLQLEKKVKVEDGKLSTLDLSQGQRKRLALLTAYLEDRPIYLFDEWAADQDPQFREIFYRQILPELKRRGKTVFVISHDDRYYSAADRLIKLYYGKVELDQQGDSSRPEPPQGG